MTFLPKVLSGWWWAKKIENTKALVLGPRKFKHWYSLDTDLCLVLGNTMIYLAEHTAGYPVHTTYEEWVESLRSNGQSLIDYDGEHLDENKVKDAQDALRWVADNLEALWN